MKTAIRFATLGFVVGLSAALMLTAIGSQRVLPRNEVLFFWPTAVLGVDFSDWADGSLWHFLRLLSIFAGNGAVYALLAACCGGFIERAQTHGGRPRRIRTAARRSGT